MSRLLQDALLLTGFWLILSGKWDAAHVLPGVGAAAAIALLSRRLFPDRPPLRLAGLVAYLPWLLWRVVLANLRTAYLVLHPGLPVEPRLLRARTTLRTPGAVALYAVSIILTPGTLVVEAEDGWLTVHALDGPSAGDVVSGSMQARVARAVETPP